MIARRFSWVWLPIILIGLMGCTEKREAKLELKVHYPKVNLLLDPQKMEDAYSMMIVSQLYRGLLRFNSGGDVVPDLAVSWKESGDRKTYTFKLRASTFSDGQKITAKNVQLTYARMFLLGAGMAADLDYIKGIKEFVATKNLDVFGVKVISDDEVEFALDHPSSLFLKHIAVADCGILPYQKLSDVEGDPTAFSGPYKIQKQGVDYVDLIKWRNDPLESKAPPSTIHFFASAESPLNLADENKTDSLDRDVVPAEKQKMLEADGWGASPTELTGEAFIILNPDVIPLDARKFLYSKVNPVTIAGLFNEPKFKPAYGIIPTGFPGVLNPTDVSSLRQTNSYTGKKISFQFDYDGDVEVDRRVVEYLKKVWVSDKIEVKFQSLVKAEKLKKMFAKKSDAIVGRKAIDYPDGFSVLTYFKGKYQSNYFFVDDPRIDGLINGIVQEFDGLKRAEAYKGIQLDILKHYTVIPLFFGSQASGLWSQRVKFAPSHPMGSHTMPFETIEMRLD